LGSATDLRLYVFVGAREVTSGCLRFASTVLGDGDGPGRGRCLGGSGDADADAGADWG